MTDEGIYRTAGYTCPTCHGPLREFQHRWVCDECPAMLIAVEDFRSACADVGANATTPVELGEPEPSDTLCPICERPMTKRTVGYARVRTGTHLTCDRHGLWLPQDVLTKTFARLSVRYVHSGGGYEGPGRIRRSASDGLTITRWRDRPRHRAKTLTPINVYGDRTLRCPACADRDLVFVGDRWACEGCRGVFVQTAAVEALVGDMIGAVWQMPAPVGTPGTRTCPICAQALATETLEGVTVDRCAGHGVWFDPAELEAVLQHADAAARPHGLVGWLRRLFG